MDHERQFKRVRHGQIIKLSATISGNTTTNHAVLRVTGFPGMLGPGNSKPEVGKDKFKFVVEFVEPTPDPIPAVFSDASSNYPDHIRLRTLENTGAAGYLSFDQDGVISISTDPSMNTEIYLYPQSFAGYFKLESVKFPGSMLQVGYKFGDNAAHAVKEEGGRCVIIHSDSLFASIKKEEMLLFDPEACPAPKPIVTPGQPFTFKSLQCVGHKRVLDERGGFDHAAYRFRVLDKSDCARDVWHRFSVFGEFAKELAKERNLELPKVPEKGSMFKSEDNEQLFEDRQKGFDQWFKEVSELGFDISATRAFAKFTQSTEPKSVAVIGGAGYQRSTNDKGVFTHATYSLQVSYQQLSWSTHKRYRELVAIANNLKSEFADQPEVMDALSQFPSKTNILPQGWGKKIPGFFSNALSLKDHSNEDFLVERQSLIHKWLDKIAHFPQVGRNRAWLDFLCKA